MTVTELIDAVLTLAYPRKFNLSMLALKEHYVTHGLTEMQRRVEGFRVANLDIVPGTVALMVSGATILPAPAGVVEQVAIGAENCQTLFADLLSRGQLQQFQSDWATANWCGIGDVEPIYPQERVVWARDDSDIMIYPWVPEPWQIAVRWRGIRRNWEPGSDVWWGELAVEALRMFVLWKTAVDDSCEPQKIAILKQDFIDEAAKLKTEDFHIRHPAPDAYYASSAVERLCRATAPAEGASA